MTARALGTCLCFVAVWLGAAALALGKDEPPLPLFALRSPTRAEPAAEDLAARRPDAQQLRQMRQLDVLFDRGAQAAAAGKLIAARTCFESIRRMPLAGELSIYRDYADQAMEAINGKGDEILKLAQQYRLEKRYAQAADLYELLVEHFKGTAIERIAADELNRLLSDPQIAADILLKRARRFEQRGELWHAYEQYYALATKYPDTDQGRQAAGKVDELRTSKALSDAVPPDDAREASKLLMIGNIRSRNRDVAAGLLPADYYYRTVINRFPGTSFAQEAQRKLKELEERR